MKRLNETKLLELVRQTDFPPLNIKWQDDLPRIELQDSNRIFRPDISAEIKWENKSYKFLIEVKSQSTPKILDNAVYQLKNYISAIQNSESSQTYYPLLVAPYLNKASLTTLAAENISGIDLSGNGLVLVPGELFVYRFGAKNKFPSNAPIKNIYRGTSSLIPRVFFSKTEFESVTEVLDEITDRSGKTTIGTVSKVLKALEEELIISRKEGIRLIDGSALLKNLRDKYRQPIIEKKVFGKADDLDDALLRMSENADRDGFLFAANEPQRYSVISTSNSTTTAYTQNIAKALNEVYFDQGERFSNLEIIETQDPTVYFDRRYEIAPGYYFTSPLQVYLELANGGKREKETAEQISESLLNFNY